MTLSTLVAKMASLAYLSAGVAAFSGKLSFQKIMKEFQKSQGLTYLSGFMALILGLILVEYHNFWVWDWTVLITIIGWVAVLKGVMLIAFPNSLSFFKNWYKNERMWSILLIAIGILFGYFGFISG